VELDTIPAHVRETAQPVRGRDGELLALAEHLDRVLSGVGSGAYQLGNPTGVSRMRARI
jgi:hypothetical protein